MGVVVVWYVANMDVMVLQLVRYWGLSRGYGAVNREIPPDGQITCAHRGGTGPRARGRGSRGFQDYRSSTMVVFFDVFSLILISHNHFYRVSSSEIDLAISYLTQDSVRILRPPPSRKHIVINVRTVKLHDHVNPAASTILTRTRPNLHESRIFIELDQTLPANQCNPLAQSRILLSIIII